MRRQLAFWLLLLPCLARADWVEPSGKVLANNERMQSAGNFAVQGVITPDEAKFRDTWNRSKTQPKLAVVDTVRPGKSVTALVLFHGCAPNREGRCDVVVEYTITGPDGVAQNAGGGPVWTEAPMKPRMLQLGRASIEIGFTNEDKPGEYKIAALVTDRVAGRALTVVSRLKLVAAKAPR